MKILGTKKPCFQGLSVFVFGGDKQDRTIDLIFNLLRLLLFIVTYFNVAMIAAMIRVAMKVFKDSIHRFIYGK